MSWLWFSACTMVLTAAIHTIVGHRRLIAPMLELDAPLLRSSLARMVLVFAWHLTSVLMILTAIVMVWPNSPVGLIIVLASAWLIAGLTDAIWSRGQHIGWPPITIAGLFGLLGGLT